MVLIPNIESLTVTDIREAFERIIEYVPYEYFDAQRAWNKSATSFISQSFWVPPWKEHSGRFFTSEDRNKYVINLCKNLRKTAEEPKTHVQEIEALLTPLFVFRVFVYGKEPGSFETDFAYRAHLILKRLPPRPPELIGFPPDLDIRYFSAPEVQERGKSRQPTANRSWPSLSVAAYLNANLIQMALYIVLAGPDFFGNALEDFPDSLAELLEVSSGLASQSSSEAESQQWYISRAALWSLWQRSLMLYHYANLRIVIDRGFNGLDRFRVSRRSTTPAPGQSLHELSIRHARQGNADAMCAWAFELLRTEPVCLSADFRTFHERYSQQWRGAPARCRKGSPASCEGTDPDGCWRFAGMVVEDQSAHDLRCLGQCSKLMWDENSYRDVSGARAIPIVTEFLTGKNRSLRYCSATERTMAISHVWSHGQGGRPHVGVNLCLHLRYIEIARSLDCDSYWWDSACIPEDHTLRSEAIQNINSTFFNSRAVLVCDKDLMQIDISEPSMQVKESILATILVCDWNVRAWTLLESLRGRHSIHILCKDNATISFRAIVQSIANKGSIDLAILSLTIPHMLPESRTKDTWTREEVGQVLSYRPASRPGDDVVIWSLLVADEAYESAEDLWRHKRDDTVPTGFLMSSAPRSNLRGFSWAPSTPYFKTQADHRSRKTLSFRAFMSRETMPGFITDKGLLAAWHVYEFACSDLSQPGPRNQPLSKDQRNLLQDISSSYLHGSIWGALLRPMSNVSTFERDRDTKTKYNGLIEGTLVAVLCSNAQSEPSHMPAEERGWTWKGVFEWDENVPLPTFSAEYEFLIE